MNATRSIGTGMRAALVLAALPAISGTLLADGLDPAEFESKVARAVETFPSFWSPPERDLRRVRVVIYAQGGGAADQASRNTDDLCLWTAMHLYHLVRNAGGYPVLPRVDDRPALEPFGEDQVRVSNPTLWVQITSASVSQSGACAAGSNKSPPELAQALIEAGVLAQSDHPPAKAEGPAVTIILPEWADPRSAQVEGLPAHRAWAERIYRGLAAYVQAERRRPEENDDEDSEDAQQPVVPYYPKHAPSTPVRRGASSIWSDGKLPASKASWFCNLYIKQAFSDLTNVYFEPVVSVEGDEIVIGGATAHPTLTGVLERALRSAGASKVRTEMRLLPEDGRLDPERWFGVCIAPMALNFGRPAEGGSLKSQLLYGEPVFLLDRQDGFYLVQGGDGYCGWVRENCILPRSRAEFKEYTTRPEVVLINDVIAEFGRIVRGSRLRVDEGASSAHALALVRPDGGHVRVSDSQVRRIEEAAMGRARAAAALDMLHVPYLFAGRSSIGLDCSGLVGTVSDRFGVVLPRDAAQQYLSGRLVATRWYPEGMQPGDRIYFLNSTGKISHTGLSLGGDHFVHSSPPGVQINSFRETDRLYREHWRNNFLGARRP